MGFLTRLFNGRPDKFMVENNEFDSKTEEIYKNRYFALWLWDAYSRIEQAKLPAPHDPDWRDPNWPPE